MLAIAALLSTSALLTPLSTKPAMRTSVKPATSFDPLKLHSEGFASFPEVDATSAAIGAMALIAAMEPQAAMAKGGEYGIWEGRIVSCAHPAMMVIVYAASAYAAFSGLQWRRLREIGDQISTLKAEQKPLALTAEQVEAGASPSARYTALGSEISALTLTRKDLAESKFRDKHYQVGSVVLGLGTAFAIEGPVNTFLRAQKLFPGPHLYAGAGIVVCWAMAASLVPLMGKGSDAARYGHMGFNVLALGLFTWQYVPPRTPPRTPLRARPRARCSRAARKSQSEPPAPWLLSLSLLFPTATLTPSLLARTGCPPAGRFCSR